MTAKKKKLKKMHRIYKYLKDNGDKLLSVIVTKNLFSYDRFIFKQKRKQKLS